MQCLLLWVALAEMSIFGILQLISIQFLLEDLVLHYLVPIVSCIERYCICGLDSDLHDDGASKRRC